MILGAAALVATGCSDDSPAGSIDARIFDAATATVDARAATLDAPAATLDASTLDAPPPLPDAAPAVPDAGTGAIQAAANVWTWVDFAGTSCDEGTSTGIGINKSDKSDNVLVFLQGGGACWSYATCFDLSLSVHGPYGASQFAHDAPGLVGGIFDRTDDKNPFADWSYVYVPYCTSDIHGGDNVIEYTEGAKSATVHHVGHANVVDFVARLAPTFPNAPKLVVSGASAGGFGATINYSTIRDAMAAQKSYLVDDSGPLFEGDDINPGLRDAWVPSWRLDKVLDPLCGVACETDFSKGFTALSTKYPDDRLALLSSVQDATIRTYFLLSADQFQTDLFKMKTDIIDPTDNFRVFFVAGQSHTMLGNIDSFMSGNSTPLTTWLSTDVNDGTFESVVPPTQ